MSIIVAFDYGLSHVGRIVTVRPLLAEHYLEGGDGESGGREKTSPSLPETRLPRRLPRSSCGGTHGTRVVVLLISDQYILFPGARQPQ